MRIKDLNDIKVEKIGEWWCSELNKRDDISEDENIKNIRSYSLSITYDNYYHVARMWLEGVDYEN